MLKMSVENIRRIMKDGMNFEGNFPLWNYRFDTNCYAFVLGLDVNVNDICDNAYYTKVCDITSYTNASY